MCDECPSLVFDCAGACEGTSVVDECGVCGGNGMQTTYVEECEEEYVCQNVQVSSQVDNYQYGCVGGACNYSQCSDNTCTSCAGCPNTCSHYGGNCSYINFPETVYELVEECGWVEECNTETVTSCP